MQIKISGKLKRWNYLIGESEAVYHGIATDMGLSNSSMMILYALCCEGEGCSLKKILLLSGLPKQTANSALRKLEAEGMLYLESDKGKHKKVFLSDEGRKLSEATVMRLMQKEDEILAKWSEIELNMYNSLTERYLTDIKKAAAELAEEYRKG